ncbi:MAG TPA: hypothetical protein VGM54_11200 [Chthoniobacter sp.]|jgi:hypothetical protein
MKTRLVLSCDAVHSSFTLSREGETQNQEFNDLREALDYAAAIVTEETPLAIYNEVGRLIVESCVGPRSGPSRSRHNERGRFYGYRSDDKSI